MTERLQKFLSRAGVCSRREAERWIYDGRVRVNGTVVTIPGVSVGENDVVEVDGQSITVSGPVDLQAAHPHDVPKGVRVWLYHKPAGLVTTHKDPEGRPTVFEDIQRYKDALNLPDHVISVGRLDLNSEGLLILTDSGAFARHMEHPSSAIVRTYRVRAFGVMDQDALKSFAALKNGLTIDGMRYQCVAVEGDSGPLKPSRAHKNYWLRMTLREGKNREIRKILNHLNFQVSRLIRVQYGPFYLDDLKPGAIKAWR